jgi:hypothetical protein
VSYRGTYPGPPDYASLNTLNTRILHICMQNLNRLNGLSIHLSEEGEVDGDD